MLLKGPLKLLPHIYFDLQPASNLLLPSKVCSGNHTGPEKLKGGYQNDGLNIQLIGNLMLFHRVLTK